MINDPAVTTATLPQAPFDQPPADQSSTGRKSIITNDLFVLPVSLAGSLSLLSPIIANVPSGLPSIVSAFQGAAGLATGAFLSAVVFCYGNRCKGFKAGWAGVKDFGNYFIQPQSLRLVLTAAIVGAVLGTWLHKLQESEQNLRQKSNAPSGLTWGDVACNYKNVFGNVSTRTGTVFFTVPGKPEFSRAANRPVNQIKIDCNNYKPTGPN
jgi:hypothetical protein